MNIKGHFRKIGVITLWCLGSLSALALLIAAINKKNSRTCQGVQIQINESKPAMSIDKKEVLRLLASGGFNNSSDKPLASFDLQKMESKIRSNPWVREAQLFFDNNEILQVRIKERIPVARVFTTTGKNFYLDSSGTQLPVNSRMPVRLTLFTGFPADHFVKRGRDSLLALQVHTMANFISGDPFWCGAIEQVNITPDNRFELVPVIGDHVVEFGDAVDYQAKFHRLLLFYRQVMCSTGFDRYARINVDYAGQVIGTRKGGTISHADSLLAIRNVLALIRLAQKAASDTSRQHEIKPLEHSSITEQNLQSYDLPGDSEKIQQPINHLPIHKH